DHLAQFIPNMSSSRTLSRNGSKALVEQTGTASVGVFRRHFRVIFAVEEEATESISISSIVGDFRRFDARYEIITLAAGHSRVVYDATIVPWVATAPLISDAVLRSMIGPQFDALIREISRRAGTGQAEDELLRGLVRRATTGSGHRGDAAPVLLAY